MEYKGYFNDKTALITGAGSGIGRALVKHMIMELGVRVVGVSQTEGKLVSLIEELPGELRNNLTCVAVDLGNWQETESKLSEYCESIDFLVNNAGFGYTCPIDELDSETVNKTIDINLKAPINLMRLVSKGMKKRKFGAIVNVSSAAGIKALDDHSVYAATKAGLDLVTKVGAKELGPYNIRVNSVNPTVVWTEMSTEFWSDPARKGPMIDKIPMRRFVELHEVVDPIVFLLSKRSSVISGVVLPIDGGLTAN